LEKKNLYTGVDEPRKTHQVYHTDPNLPQYAPPAHPNNVAPIDRMPIVGYQGYVPTYMHPLQKMKKMEEMRYAYDTGQMQLPPKEEVDPEELDVPIVGYTGFIPGKKARNVYGESYHQTAIDNEAKKKLEE